MIARLAFAAVAILLVPGAAQTAGGKTIVGRCLAVIDGKTRLDEPCNIDLAVGGGFTLADAFKVVLDKAAGTGAATWSHYDVAEATVTDALGAMTRSGACWTNARAKICAWDGTATAAKDREAPYTDFHPLVGKDVEGRCHMGECENFRFAQARLIDHNAHEALYEINEHGWVIDYPDEDYKRKGTRSGDADNRFYVLCSKTRPAMMWRFKPGPWTYYEFAPGAELSVSGASELINVKYAAACHARTKLLSTPAAVMLGYPSDTAPSSGDGETIDKPEDALKENR